MVHTFSIHSLPFHAMADFDAVVLIPEQLQIQKLQFQNQQLIGELQRILQNQLPQHVLKLPRRYCVSLILNVVSSIELPK